MAKLGSPCDLEAFLNRTGDKVTDKTRGISCSISLLLKRARKPITRKAACRRIAAPSPRGPPQVAARAAALFHTQPTQEKLDRLRETAPMLTLLPLSRLLRAMTGAFWQSTWGRQRANSRGALRSVGKSAPSCAHGHLSLQKRPC